MMWRWLLARACVAALCVARPAVAQVAVVGLEYRVPAECPARDVFVRELGARTNRVQTAGSGAQGTLFVDISRAGPLRGAILFREASGRETERSVVGESCDDVVRALALIAAVLVDPETQAGAPLPSEESLASTVLGGAAVSEGGAGSPPAGAAEASATPADSVTAPVAPADREPVPVRRPARAPAVHDSAATASPAPKASWHFGLGGGAALRTGVAPDAVFGFAVEASVERRLRKAFAFALGITVQRSQSGTVQTEGGDADFTWTAARLWMCPWRWPSAGSASLAACAAFEAGALKGRGFNTDQAEEQTTAWLAPGGFVRGEVRPAQILALALDAGFGVPLVRTDFYFDPGISAFKVPWLGAFAVLGIRLQTD